MYDYCKENYDGPAKYVVVAYGGEYEDSWEKPCCVTDTEEDAQAKIDEYESAFNKKLKSLMPKDRLNELSEAADEFIWKEMFGDRTDVSQEEENTYYDAINDEAACIYKYCQANGINDYTEDYIRESSNFHTYENDYFYRTSGYSINKIPYYPAN